MLRKKHFFKILYILVLGATFSLYQNFISTPATPTTLHLYISPNGNDNNSGESPSRPKRSLQKIRYALENRFITRNLPHTDVIIHIAGGRYYNQVDNWSFHMPRHRITFRGDPNNRPIFDGASLNGQNTMLRISRGSLARQDTYNITIENLVIQNYLSAVIIDGGKAGNYIHSNGGVVLSNMIFRQIGKAYDPGSKNSHQAVLVYYSHNNQIINCRFQNISNDIHYGPDYQTFGLHAIYVIRSNGTQIRQNTFENIYARGVIKLRHFSNYSKISWNRFHDNTTLLQDDFINASECHAAGETCTTYANNECPSYDTEWRDNRYKFFRSPSSHRPTVQIDMDLSTQPFCQSADFFRYYELDVDDDFNSPHLYYKRVYEQSNVLDARL